MPRPDLTRVMEYFHRYINQVKEDDLSSALQIQTISFNAFLQSIPESKTGYRYAEGKWSIKEVLQHIIDTERIFAYRALCFSRNEASELPGFDENSYSDNSAADKRQWDDLVEEFAAVRKATELLFSSFNQEQIERNGVASGNPNYVLGIGFIIAGHVEHHQRILKERYL
jgi:hypothetical protein